MTAAPADDAHQLAVQPALADLWFSLLDGARRALCALACLDPSVAKKDWHFMAVDERMRLVRAMAALADVTIDCAMALDLARLKLEAVRAAATR